MNYYQRFILKVNLLNLPNSFNSHRLPLSLSFPKHVFGHPKVGHIALIHHTRALLLAQLIYAPGTLIIALDRHPDSPVPWHIDHLEPLSVPDMGLHPAVLTLSKLVEVQKETQLATVTTTFGTF